LTEKQEERRREKEGKKKAKIRQNSEEKTDHCPLLYL
jgi:hypothetical protein